MHGQKPHWCGSNIESATHDNLSGLEKMKETFSLIGFFFCFTVLTSVLGKMIPVCILKTDCIHLLGLL